jgi:hypothetical protein
MPSDHGNYGSGQLITGLISKRMPRAMISSGDVYRCSNTGLKVQSLIAAAHSQRCDPLCTRSSDTVVEHSTDERLVW